MEPPAAKKLRHAVERHGERIEDPYHWLRDDSRKDPEVLRYLEAENAYTAAVLEPTSLP